MAASVGAKAHPLTCLQPSASPGFRSLDRSRSFRGGALDVVADPFDDLSGSIGGAHETAERFLDFVQVGRLLIQEIQSGTRVVSRGGNRLGDVVGERGVLVSCPAGKNPA